VSTIAEALATTRWISIIRASSTTSSTGSGQSISARITAGVAAVALEHTSVHVRIAARIQIDRYLVTSHVDLARDIHGGVVSGGNFTPCVPDLTILVEDGHLIVETGESAGDPVGHGDIDLCVDAEGVRDVWLADVHEGGGVVSCGVVPEDHCDGDVGTTVILECEDVGSVTANPDDTIVGAGIYSLRVHSNVGHMLAVCLAEAADWVGAIEALAEGSATSGEGEVASKDGTLAPNLCEICKMGGEDRLTLE